MNNKQVVGIFCVSLFFFSFVSIVSATHIEIFYPQNNTTTELCYANGSSYYTNTTNVLNDNNLSIVILKDQIVTTNDILNDPKIIYHKMLPVFMVIVFVFIMIVLTKIMKGVIR